MWKQTQESQRPQRIALSGASFCSLCRSTVAKRSALPNPSFDLLVEPSDTAVANLQPLWELARRAAKPVVVNDGEACHGNL